MKMEMVPLAEWTPIFGGKRRWGARPGWVGAVPAQWGWQEIAFPLPSWKGLGSQAALARSAPLPPLCLAPVLCSQLLAHL